MSISPDEFYSHRMVKGEAPSLWLYRLYLTLATLVFKTIFRVEVTGLENLPKDKPFVIMANHTSLLDPVFVAIMLRPLNIRFASKEEACNAFFLRWALPRCGAIPVKRDSADRKFLRRATTILKNGEPLGIFPEATRMRKPSKVLNLRAGAVLVASMTKASLVPVGIEGAYRIKPYKKPFVRFPKVTIHIGEALELDDPLFAGLEKHELFDAATNATMARVYELAKSPVPKMFGFEEIELPVASAKESES